MIEAITHQGQLLALILSHRFQEPGIHFFTPDDLSQPLASMRHPVRNVIPPHVHHPVAREVAFTQEGLIIKPIARAGRRLVAMSATAATRRAATL